jgi:hypothetical protein
MPQPDLADLAARFERFGQIETPDTSPLYSRLALAIARDEPLLALAAACPRSQPVANLFLGAVHYLLLQGVPGAAALRRYYPSLLGPGEPVDRGAGLEAAFRAFCLAHQDEIVALERTRLVQTNEVSRCAALLPAFGIVASEANRPLWLAEVGASAGLNLCWDRYGYSYQDPSGSVVKALGDTMSPVQLGVCLRGPGMPPLPETLPTVAARTGIDLHPVDVTDGDAVAWLRALIWPEHAARVDKLLRAAELVKLHPPRILSGDALDLLPGVLAGAPRDALLVVLHTFTLNQFAEDGRRAFRAFLYEASHQREVIELGITMVAGASYARVRLGRYRAGVAEVRTLAHCDGHVRWLEWST